MGRSLNPFHHHCGPGNSLELPSNSIDYHCWKHDQAVTGYFDLDHRAADREFAKNTVWYYRWPFTLKELSGMYHTPDRTPDRRTKFYRKGTISDSQRKNPFYNRCNAGRLHKADEKCYDADEEKMVPMVPVELFAEQASDGNILPFLEVKFKRHFETSLLDKFKTGRPRYYHGPMRAYGTPNMKTSSAMVPFISTNADTSSTLQRPRRRAPSWAPSL